MYSITISFTDLFGGPQSDTFFFHLTQDEVVRYISEYGKNWGNVLEEIAERQDALEMYLTIRDLVLLAYGERSKDGVNFLKSPEITQRFETHVAFDDVIEKILESPDKFVIGILPANVAGEVKASLESA